MVSTRTAAAGGCPGPASRCASQHPTTVAIRSNILKSNLPHSEKLEMGIALGWLAVNSTQPKVVVETASYDVGRVTGADLRAISPLLRPGGRGLEAAGW